MSTYTILIVMVIGVAAGILGGMVGVGGGTIIVPALIYALGYTQVQAQGTSLGLIMLPVGILGFITYMKKCNADGTPISYTVILLLGLGFVLGSLLGSRIAVSIDKTLLKNIFAIILIIIAGKILFFDK
jgi:uncharacterized protein